MKHVLSTSALAIVLLATASGTALAQDRDHDRGGPQAQPAGPPAGVHPAGPPAGEHRGPPPGPPQGGFRQDAAPGGQPNSARHDGAPPVAQPGPGARPGDRGQGDRWQGDRWQGDRGDRGQDRRFQGGQPGPQGPNPGYRRDDHRDDHRADGGPQTWRPDGRFDNHRFEAWGGRPGGGPPHWSAGRYPPVMTWNHDRFRAGFYRPPPGYYYRPWGYGEYLPRPWFVRDYWLMDFLDFDLPYPPPGFTWVRVGPDALMIDQFNGRIVQVVHGIFW